MPNRSWQGGGAPNPTWWSQANNWVGGVIPIDGDTVDFLAANWVADPAVGPAAPVVLISITDDAGFSGMGGGNPIICYTNCTVTTVTILSACYIFDGTIVTASLSGAGSRISGVATITTATLSGGVAAVTGGATIETLNLNGAADYALHAAITVATVNLNGAGAYINNGTYTTVNMNGSAVELRANPICTTVYVDSLNADVSATAIAGGQITNGPYVLNRNAVLYDFDTGLVMLDTSRVKPYHEGAW